MWNKLTMIRTLLKNVIIRAGTSLDLYFPESHNDNFKWGFKVTWCSKSRINKSFKQFVFIAFFMFYGFNRCYCSYQRFLYMNLASWLFCMVFSNWSPFQVVSDERIFASRLN